jgi:putative FmdB family regulatory protein
MPVYEYQCNTCGARFEVLTRMDAPSPVCPKCGAEVRRLVSAAAFHLKGSGWYKDGYGLKGATPETKAAGGESTSKPAEAAPAAAPATPAPAKATPTSGGSTPAAGS